MRELGHLKRSSEMCIGIPSSWDAVFHSCLFYSIFISFLGPNKQVRGLKVSLEISKTQQRGDPTFASFEDPSRGSRAASLLWQVPAFWRAFAVEGGRARAELPLLGT